MSNTYQYVRKDLNLLVEHILRVVDSETKFTSNIVQLQYFAPDVGVVTTVHFRQTVSSWFCCADDCNLNNFDSGRE